MHATSTNSLLVVYKKTKGLLTDPTKFYKSFKKTSASYAEKGLSFLEQDDEHALARATGDDQEYKREKEQAHVRLLPEIKALIPALPAGGVDGQLGYLGDDMCLDRLTQTEQKYLNKVTPDGDLPKLNTKQMPDFVSVAAERLGMDKVRLTKVVNKTRETYGRLGQWHARKSNVTLVALSKAMKVIAMFRNEEEVTEELQKNAEEACLRAVLQESHRLMSAGEDMQNYFEQEFGINGVTSSFRKFMVMGGELNEHQKKEVVQEMRDLGTAQKAVRDACQPYFVQAVPNATGTIAAVRATTTANTTATAGPTTPAATTTFSLTEKGVSYRTPGAKEKEDSLLGSQASTAHERASAKARAKARDTALGKEVTASMAKVDLETTAKASADSGLAFAAVLPPGSSEHLFTDPPPGCMFKFMLYEDSDGSQRMVRRTVRRPGARRSRANGKENNTDEQVPTRRCNVQIPGTLDALIARYPGSQVASTGGHGLGSEPSPTTATITDTVGRDGSGGSRNLEEVQGAAKDSSSGDRGPGPGQAGILAGGTDSPVPKSHLPNAKAQPTGSQQNASGHEGERPERNTALRSLQAGGHPGSKGAGEAGRLCMQAGPRECLLPNGSGATATQTNEDQGTELGLKGSGGATVQGRQPGPETDPRKVHKATTRLAAEVQGIRNKDNNQDRRCPDPGGLYGEMLATHMDCGKSDDLPGVCMEAEQVPAPTDAENRVPRSDVLLRSDAMLDAAREVLQGGTDHRRIDIGLNHYGDMYRKETYPSGGSQSKGHMDGDDRNGTRGKAAINGTSRHTTRDDEQPRVQKSIMEYVNGGKQARPEQPRGSSPGAEAALPSGRHGGHRYAYGGRLEMEWATVRPGHYFGDPMDGRMRLPMGTDTSGKVSPYSGSSIPLQSGGSTKLAHHQEGNCGYDKGPGYSPENVPTLIQRHDSMQDGCYDHQLKKAGGRLTHLNKLIWSTVHKLVSRQLLLQVSHVAGLLNISDAPSRQVLGLEEFGVNKLIYGKLAKMWGAPMIDLFAAEWNAKCEVYASKHMWDLQATYVDSMTLVWTELVGRLWINPPVHKKLLLKIVRKLQQEQVLEATLMVPLWKSIWLSEALAMTVTTPILLQANQQLLLPPKAYTLVAELQGQDWSTPPTWTWFVCLNISGGLSRLEASRQRLATTLESCTNRKQMVRMVAHTIAHTGAGFGTTSTRKLAEAASGLSQMWLSAIVPEN